MIKIHVFAQQQFIDILHGKCSKMRCQAAIFFLWADETPLLIRPARQKGDLHPMQHHVERERTVGMDDG